MVLDKIAKITRLNKELMRKLAASMEREKKI